jgi:S1-C subfamily serine protease
MTTGEEPERLPCRTCGELAAVAARQCPHCFSSLLVDVTLSGRVTDGRRRYRVARALHALPEAPSLGEIQSSLVGSPPAAVRGVTRAFAHAALDVLSRNGLRGSMEEPVARSGEGRGLSLGGVLKGAALVLLLAMGYTAWHQLLHKPSPAPSVTSGSTKAARPAARAGAPALSPRELAQRALPATVSLRCRNSVGSGFFIDPERVITNAHVLCPAGETLQVGLSDDRTLTGRVERANDDLDLALVRVSGADARALPLGDVADLAVGDRVTIVGSPVGLDFTVQEGSISSLQRAAFGVAYMQLDAKISPGNSGGPVVDSQGRVVGIVSMKLVGEGVEGIGLAIPINYVYDLNTAFVAPPTPAAAGSEAFHRMVAQAQEQSESGTEPGPLRTDERGGGPAQGSTLDDRPILVAGYIDQYQRLVVRILRATEVSPGFEEITVTLWSGSDAFCTIKGDVRDWKQSDPTKPGSGLDRRSASVLQKIAPGRTFFVGESPLRWDLCDRTKMRSGVELELEGANPIANRLLLR